MSEEAQGAAAKMAEQNKSTDTAAVEVESPAAAPAKPKTKATGKAKGKITAGRYICANDRSYRDPHSGVEFNPAYSVPVDKDGLTGWLQSQVDAGLIRKE